MMNQTYASRLEEKGLEFKFAKIEKAEEVQKVKDLMREDRILIVNVKPILRESIQQTEYVLQELHSFCMGEGYSLARMGEGRVLILPPYVRF